MCLWFKVTSVRGITHYIDLKARFAAACTQCQQLQLCVNGGMSMLLDRSPSGKLPVCNLSALSLADIIVKQAQMWVVPRHNIPQAVVEAEQPSPSKLLSLGAFLLKITQFKTVYMDSIGYIIQLKIT